MRVKNDTDTQGNFSPIPLPKVDKIYTNQHGAKIFTTLDCGSSGSRCMCNTFTRHAPRA